MGQRSRAWRGSGRGGQAVRGGCRRHQARMHAAAAALPRILLTIHHRLYGPTVADNVTLEPPVLAQRPQLQVLVGAAGSAIDRIVLQCTGQDMGLLCGAAGSAMDRIVLQHAGTSTPPPSAPRGGGGSMWRSRECQGGRAQFRAGHSMHASRDMLHSNWQPPASASPSASTKAGCCCSPRT